MPSTRFWQGLCAVLFVANLLQVAQNLGNKYLRPVSEPKWFFSKEKSRHSDECDNALSNLASRDLMANVLKQVCEKQGCKEGRNATGVGRLKGKIRLDAWREIGRNALQNAKAEGLFLLTVQIGGMDGKSNDPMYETFSNQEQDTLKHWVPLVFEPVMDNFVALNNTYHADLKQRGVKCPILFKRAIMYDQEPESTCTFCRFDTSPSAPQICQEHPDWMKYQIGTLQCEQSRKFFASNFDLCIVQDPVECGTVESAMQKWGIPPSAFAGAMLQMDVEGFETAILKGLLGSLVSAHYPLVVHLEQKVLQGRNELAGLVSLLIEKGYALYDDGEDIYAFLSEVIL